MIKVIRAKLHGIKVTNADLDYHGSITLDPEHCELAGIYPLEFVEIWNKSSGARISTYVIFGAVGSRCCILNGAAARTCQIGDQLAKGSALDIPGPEHEESAKHDHRRPRLTAMIRPVFQAGGGYELVLRAPQG